MEKKKDKVSVVFMQLAMLFVTILIASNIIIKRYEGTDAFDEKVSYGIFDVFRHK